MPTLYAVAQDPVVALVTIICVFVAGFVCGKAWRERSTDAPHQDAGDTHAHLHAGVEPFEPWPRSCTASRRVRAGHAPLPYSYDSRKAANPAAPPSPPPAR
jgi:hypothetical protein